MLFCVFAVFYLQMAGFSSDASYKQHSPPKASVLGELHEAQRSIRRLEEKLQKMEVQQARPSHSINDGYHSHRPSSRGSSNALGREEEHRRRKHHHHSHEESYTHDQRYHQVFNISCGQVPSFNGDNDPNVYLEWETKVDHYFHVYKVQDDQKLSLVSLSFLGYAKEWWHKIVMDIIYRKKPHVVSWNALKECMRARFVPPSRKEHLLKFQRLPQGHRMVDEYFKDFETTLTKMNMHANEESKIKWFVRGLRRDIREIV